MFSIVVYVLTIIFFAYILYEYLTCEENYEVDEHELTSDYTIYEDNNEK